MLHSIQHLGVISPLQFWSQFQKKISKLDVNKHLTGETLFWLLTFNLGHHDCQTHNRCFTCCYWHWWWSHRGHSHKWHRYLCSPSPVKQILWPRTSTVSPIWELIRRKFHNLIMLWCVCWLKVCWTLILICQYAMKDFSLQVLLTAVRIIWPQKKLWD